MADDVDDLIKTEDENGAKVAYYVMQVPRISLQLGLELIILELKDAWPLFMVTQTIIMIDLN